MRHFYKVVLTGFRAKLIHFDGDLVDYRSGKREFYEKGGLNRHYSCSPEEGIVYGTGVWLEQRDDERAKEFLINQFSLEVEELKTKIENKQILMEMVEEAL